MDVSSFETEGVSNHPLDHYWFPAERYFIVVSLIFLHVPYTIALSATLWKNLHCLLFAVMWPTYLHSSSRVVETILHVLVPVWKYCFLSKTHMFYMFSSLDSLCYHCISICISLGRLQNSISFWLLQSLQERWSTIATSVWFHLLWRVLQRSRTNLSNLWDLQICLSSLAAITGIWNLIWIAW